MRAFKEEMRQEMHAFKEEMRAARERADQEMKQFREEMQAFKEEMRAARERADQEMRQFREEMQAAREKSDQKMEEFHRELGRIANKQGVLTESFVAPSIPRVIQEYFGLESEDHMVNRRRRDQKGEWHEFDVITVAGEYVFLTSTKTTLRDRDVREFEKMIPVFRETFPEFSGKKLIGILAALDISEAQLKYAQRRGFLVLGVGRKIMEVKNSEGFKPKVWD